MFQPGGGRHVVGQRQRRFLIIRNADPLPRRCGPHPEYRFRLAASQRFGEDLNEGRDIFGCAGPANAVGVLAELLTTWVLGPVVVVVVSWTVLGYAWIRSRTVGSPKHHEPLDDHPPGTGVDTLSHRRLA